MNRRPPLLAAHQRDVALPPWRKVAQNLPHRGLPSVEDAVRTQMARPEVAACLPPGSRVALAVGSRGVSRIDEIVRCLVQAMRAQGLHPFVVPAMGSHGGGTAAGQQEVLASLGVTESAVGAPIRAGMETVELGSVLGGVPVHVDRIAYTEADLVVPVGRVKPHTDFRGPLESGLHKMLAIGLGKHRGAAHLHTYPLSRFSEVVSAAGSLIRARVNVPFGIAVVEDSYEEPAVIEAVLNDGMEVREAELLTMAKAWLPRLPFDSVDILVVQEMGKNISGAGMDPNVTGRFPLGNIRPSVTVGSLLVLDITSASHGNASGIGMADITTARAAGKIDWTATYTNHAAAGSLNGAKLPLVASTDREALDLAARCAVQVASSDLRIAWIRNTLQLAELVVSEPLWASRGPDSQLTALSEPAAMLFDEQGSLVV